MHAPQIKICGLTRRSDAEVVAASGARYGGVILAPGGRRSLSPEEAALLFAALPLRRVGVFVDATVDATTRAAETAGLEVLQLHGDESAATVRALRAADGGWSIWKVVRVRDPGELGIAVERYGADVDGLMLDGWSPDAHGGVGVRFDWEALARERALIPDGLPLIVAGGLNAGNVARAISLLDPTVVDVSSGVERSPGVKEPAAIAAFIEAAGGRPL